MEEDEKIDLTEDFTVWLHEQSKERMDVATARAEKRDTEYWDEESRMNLLIEILHEMYIGDVMSELVQEGYVQGEVMEDGQVGYSVTKTGDAWYESEAA